MTSQVETYGSMTVSSIPQRGSVVLLMPRRRVYNHNQNTNNDTMTTTMHRGGFSTSICDLFSTKRERSDCCALACCGLLLSDKNRYLLDNNARTSWCWRLGLNVGLPVAYLTIMGAIGALLFPNDDDDDTSSTSPLGALWSRLTFWGFVGIVTVLLIRARNQRLRVRQQVMTKMYHERYSENNTQGRATLDFYLQTHFNDARVAHSNCCCCYPTDFVYNNTNNVGGTESDNGGDFCTKLWKCIASLCCLSCCGAWCMCCGMCAIGQEYRELALLVEQEEELKVDYVTFEPFAEYYPKILELRHLNITSFWSHVGALSQLSKKLVKVLGLALLVLLIIALSGINGNFTLLNMLVVLATFLQAFFILFLVHWLWHRFDLSLDAVVKYFGSGFVLCTGLALAYELLVSLVLGLVFQVVVMVGVGIEISEHSDSGNSQPTNNDIKEYVKEFAKEYPWIWGILIFMNAFVVAALVEELAKYFSFWMVEHPDLEQVGSRTVTTTTTRRSNHDDDDFASNNNNTPYLGVNTTDAIEEAQQDEDHNKAPDGHNIDTGIARDEELGSSTDMSFSRSLDSLGLGITIAMVATALGFACCENLLYVFVYTPPTISNEITTLVVRSVFPVHPLAAAIQSIGVCKRDLEGRSNEGIGRIIFPAWLLHGSFDFILMLVAFLESLNHLENDKDDDDNLFPSHDDSVSPHNKDETNEPTTATKPELISLLVALVIVLLGVVYYIIVSRAQRKRLRGLEQTLALRQHGASVVPLANDDGDEIVVAA